MPESALSLRELLDYLPSSEGLVGLRASLTASSSPDEGLRWSRAGEYVTMDARRVDPDRLREALDRSRKEEEERVRQLFSRARKILDALTRGERKDAATVLLEMGSGELDLGRPRRAIPILTQAVEVAAALPDRRLEGRAVRLLAKAFWRSGSLDRALDEYRRARTQSAESGDRVEEIRSIQGLGNVRASQGHWPEAWRHHLEALRRSTGDEPDVLLLRGQTYNNLSQVVRRLGRLIEARRYQDEAATIWEQVDAPRDRLVHLNNEGLLLLALGRIEEARLSFHRGLQGAQTAFARGIFLINLAETALRSDDPALAGSLAREAEEWALEAGADDVLIEAYLLLGVSLRERGDDQGVTFFEKGLELARSGPFDLLRARVHLEYGRLRSDTADAEEARAHFEESRRIAAELGAPLEQAEAEAEIRGLE